MKTEAEIRMQACKEIEAGLTALLDRIAKAAPSQSAGLFGVAAGMAEVIRKARKGEKQSK